MFTLLLQTGIRLGSLVHDARKRMSNAQLDKLFAIIKDRFIPAIEEYGHMDRPSTGPGGAAIVAHRG